MVLATAMAQQEPQLPEKGKKSGPEIFKITSFRLFSLKVLSLLVVSRCYHCLQLNDQVFLVHISLTRNDAFFQH